MNTILISKNYEDYVSGYYHHDINEAFMELSEGSYLYGEGYPNYDKSDTIYEVIKKAPFADPDLIVVGTSWEIQDESITEFDPHPNIDLTEVDIPSVFFLNKEYKKIDRKLRYIQRNQFDIVSTVHHDFEKWEKETGVEFIRSMFAINPNLFGDHEFENSYDFGFSGSLHADQIDIRVQMKEELFENPESKSNQYILPSKRLRPIPPLRDYDFYWAEWGSTSRLKRSLLPLTTSWGKYELKPFARGMLVPSLTEYPKYLNTFKAYFSTPAPAGIVSPRYFQCPASKTLLLCPKAGEYAGIFKDGKNCLMFENDLSDLIETLEYALDDDAYRRKIVENAYEEVMTEHTYVERVKRILDRISVRY